METPMRILITAGPTREYLDDVRYLSNASSGRMGYAIAASAIEAGHEVTLVSGPVAIEPPEHCQVVSVETTAQMRDACLANFDHCDGVIAAAAVCDYKPAQRIAGKISKSGESISIEMIETDDVLAELGRIKQHRWVIGFALEAENARENALQKLRAKQCDWIVVNNPSAIGSEINSVEFIDPAGTPVAQWSGRKIDVARSLMSWLDANISHNRTLSSQ